MKFFTGWLLAAGLALAATAVQAQAPHAAGPGPYVPISDFGGPYAGGPYGPPPREYPGPRYGQGPMLLPPTEVYTVLRESGFSPLGIPRQRGYVYTISVIDRSGDDGRLVIDARNGRILRFIPAYRIGEHFNDDLTLNGPQGPLPPAPIRGAPQSARPALNVASRTVPVPKPSPIAAASKPAASPEPAPKPAAAAEPVKQPAPVQQSAAAQPKQAEAQSAPPAAVTTGAAPARPAAPLAPTQDMPQVQGLE